MTNLHSPVNLILKALPQSAYERFEQKLVHRKLQHKQVLACPGEELEYAYFPDTGMISGIIVTSEGVSVETSTIGKEGFVGINFVLDSDFVDRKLIAQIDGEGWIMPRDQFKKELTENGDLRFLVHRFALTLFHQTAQIAACNRLHTIEERCARWLLLCEDRSRDNAVHLTQEFLSMMLGVRRSGVSVALRTLQAAGLIDTSRATIQILDRPGLLECSCGCYQQAQAFFQQTMGFSFSV